MKEPKLIGEKIKFLRQNAGFSQAQLAEGIITQSQISNIEKGKIIPLCTTLFQLANKLGVDVNYFYEHAYDSRHDYINEVKIQIRKAIRERDYTEVERLILAERNNPSFKNSFNRQFLQWHLGIVEYYNKWDINKSLSTLGEALEMDTELNIYNSKLQKIEILISIAIIYNETGQYKDSIQVYEQALNKLLSLIDVRDLKIEIRICYGIAKSLYKIDEYQKSISFCNRGILKCINHELLYLLGELYYQVGQNYEKQNSFKKAEEYFLKAKHLFEIENKTEFIKIVQDKLNTIGSHGNLKNF
jgi:transcriptional regulator with XRE-family HTH domain